MTHEVSIVNSDKTVIVDLADKDKVYGRWYLDTYGYPRRASDDRVKGSYVYMHWVIIGKPPKGMLVDHINRNRLDNRRANLRICTQSQNGMNRDKSTLRGKPTTSKFRGVTKVKCGWQAQIGAQKRSRYIGTFGTEEEAAKAYDIEAIKHHGEFARLNFPTPTRSGE